MASRKNKKTPAKKAPAKKAAEPVVEKEKEQNPKVVQKSTKRSRSPNAEEVVEDDYNVASSSSTKAISKKRPQEEEEVDDLAAAKKRRDIRRASFDEDLFPRPSPDEPVSLAHWHYAAGFTTEAQRDDEMAHARLKTTSKKPSDDGEGEERILSSKALDNKNFSRKRRAKVGDFGSSVPSLKLHDYYLKLPRIALSNKHPDLILHFWSLKLVYPQYDELMAFNSHEKVCLASLTPFPHDSHQVAWTKFLGQVAAMYHIHLEGMEGKTISGIANAYSCDKDELHDDVEKMMKREYTEDLVSFYRIHHFGSSFNHPLQTPVPLPQHETPRTNINDNGGQPQALSPQRRRELVEKMKSIHGNRTSPLCATCLEIGNPKKAHTHTTANHRH